MTYAPSDIAYQYSASSAAGATPTTTPPAPYYQMAAQQPYKPKKDEAPAPWWAGKPALPTAPSITNVLQPAAPMWQGAGSAAPAPTPGAVQYNLPSAPNIQDYLNRPQLPKAPKIEDYLQGGSVAQNNGIQPFQAAPGQPYAANVLSLNPTSVSDVLRGVDVNAGMSGQQSPYGNVPMSYSDVLRGYVATPPAQPVTPTQPTYSGGYYPQYRRRGGGYGGYRYGGGYNSRRTVAALTRWNID